MNDRPDAAELLRAVERFLREEAVPALEGRHRYHARVAAHVVALVGRELARGDEDLRAEEEGLRRVLAESGEEEPRPGPPGAGGAPEAGPPLTARLAALRACNAELVRRIRAGHADTGPWRRSVLAHLRRVVDAKLAVAQGSARPASPARGSRDGGEA